MERSLPELPDDIIRDIFSYANLTNDEIIQYSLLSKQLQHVLQTSPVFSFNYQSIRHIKPNDLIKTYLFYNEKIYRAQLSYIRSNLNRYHRENIPLETFTINLKTKSRNYVLPRHIYKAESLVELNLIRCCLEPGRKVVLPNLKRLRICDCSVDKKVLGKIIMGCPSIEYLNFETSHFKDTNFKVANLRNLKQLEITLCTNEHLELTSTPNLESIKIAGNIDFGSTEYPRLKSMKVAESKTLDQRFFINFASKFPMLEKLHLTDCNSLQGIDLSSKSLKKLKLGYNIALQDAYFDVPNLIHFGYKGYTIITKLRIRGNLGRWSSCIQLDEYIININTSWFMKLNNLLAELIASETSIIVSLLGTWRFFNEVRPITVDPFILPRVREFTINANQSEISLSSVSAMLDGVFSICLPKIVSVKVIWHNNIPKLLGEKNLLHEKLVSKSNHHHCSVGDIKVVLRTGEEFKLPFKEYWNKCFEALEQDKTVIQQICYQLEYRRTEAMSRWIEIQR